jgi:hypothetical protein
MNNTTDTIDKNELVRNELVRQHNLAEIIRRRNTEFKAASPAQRRVMVAKDVIDLLKNDKINATTGCWVEINELYDTEVSLQKCILDNSCDLSCDCCALGSIMVSLVGFKNRVKCGEVDSLNFGDIYDGERDVVGIKNLFTKTQLQMIEIAYECGDGYFDEDAEYKSGDNVTIASSIVKKCVKYGLRIENEEARIVSIMRNIIRNGGEFIP